jgi:hypothetical protein
MIGVAARWNYDSELKERAMIDKYLENPDRANFAYGRKVYIHMHSLFNRPTSFTLTQLKYVRIDNPRELEFAIDGLSAIAEGAMPIQRGIPLITNAVSMIDNLLAYCAATLKIPNAVRIRSLIEDYYARTRSPLQILTLVNLARGLQAQMGASTLPGEFVDTLLPSAVEVIMEAILNRGQNSLTLAQRQILMGYARLACDVFVLGRYVQALPTNPALTVGEFLEHNPDLSAERLNDIFNPTGRPHTIGSAAGFRRRLSSEASWDLWLAGYGRMS